MKDTDYADHLIDIYLSGITSVTNDAGWEGDSMMARLIAFHGEIPESTGFVESNLSMILAIERLRENHALFDDLKRIIGGMLTTCGESDKILALLARRYYQGMNDKTGRRYTNADRMLEIGHGPGIVDNPEGAAKAWENAERYFKRRVKIAREIFIEKLQRRGIAA